MGSLGPGNSRTRPPGAQNREIRSREDETAFPRQTGRRFPEGRSLRVSSRKWYTRSWESPDSIASHLHLGGAMPLPVRPEPNSNERVDRNGMRAVNRIEPGREAVDRPVHSEPGFRLRQPGEVPHEACGCRLYRSPARRDLLRALDLIHELVQVTIDQFDSTVQKVLLRELPRPLEEISPLWPGLSLIAPRDQSSRDESSRQGPLIPDRRGRASLISTLDLFRVFEMPGRDLKQDLRRRP